MFLNEFERVVIHYFGPRSLLTSGHIITVLAVQSITSRDRYNRLLFRATKTRNRAIKPGIKLHNAPIVTIEKKNKIRQARLSLIFTPTSNQKDESFQCLRKPKEGNYPN